jgi:hypothetical protein
MTEFFIPFLILDLINNIHRSGRPKLITERGARKLSKIVKPDRRQSLRDITHEFSCKFIFSFMWMLCRSLLVILSFFCWLYGQQSFTHGSPTNDIRHVNLVTKSVISHEWGKKRKVLTTSGTFPWSSVTQIFHSSQPSHGGNRKTFDLFLLTLRTTKFYTRIANYNPKKANFSELFWLNMIEHWKHWIHAWYHVKIAAIRV